MGIAIAIATIGPVATNCYIAGNDTEAVVIDPASGTSDDEEIIVSLVGTRAVSAILITHGHFDHIAGLDTIRKRYASAPVYIHEKDAIMLTSAQHNLSSAFGIDIAFADADKKIADGDVIHAGSMTFSVLHTPGHTPGSVCYAIEDVLFCGDTLFAFGIGRTDFPGGDGELIISSIKEKLFTLPPETHLYPGHDSDFTIAERMKADM
ncbi:MAG: MBL fold metallo-hydrolase [Spirochaetota bacterium]